MPTRLDPARYRGRLHSILLRIQALPQELQDEILFFTLQLPGSTQITRNYKLPLALHLDRTSRVKYSNDYYSTTTFECTTLTLAELRKSSRAGASHLYRWLHSLRNGDKSLINALQITKTKPYWDHADVDTILLFGDGRQVKEVIRELGIEQVCRRDLVFCYKIIGNYGEVETRSLSLKEHR